MHKLFKNRRYIGEYRHGDVVQPGGMPAFVSEGTFARMQERMSKNKHKPAEKKADEEYILTTKLFCSKDGVMMVGAGGTSKTGKVHHSYKCGNAIYKKSCNKKTVRSRAISSFRYAWNAKIHQAIRRGGFCSSQVFCGAKYSLASRGAFSVY